ncbi:hypothetical protein RSOL_184370, partial [Rhizoctonia solani AG-3 Rhs1AP]
MNAPAQTPSPSDHQPSSYPTDDSRDSEHMSQCDIDQQNPSQIMHDNEMANDMPPSTGQGNMGVGTHETSQSLVIRDEYPTSQGHLQQSEIKQARADLWMAKEQVWMWERDAELRIRTREAKTEVQMRAREVKAEERVRIAEERVRIAERQAWTWKTVEMVGLMMREVHEGIRMLIAEAKQRRR